MRIKSNLLRATTLSIVVLAGTTIVSAAGQAAPVGPMCFAARSQSQQERNDELNVATAKLWQAGASQAEVNRQLDIKFGLRLASARQVAEVGPSVTNPSNIIVYAPEIYRDSCSGRYTVFARWRFTNMNELYNEVPGTCNNPCHLSGYDGFGVAFNRPVTSAGGHSMTTWGRSSYYPIRTDRAWPEADNTTGAAYAGIDHFKTDWWNADYDDYSFYNGQLVIGINTPGCGSLQAFSKYAHDWSNVTINGISVGPWSVGFSFSSGTTKWTKSGVTGSNTVYPC